MASKSGPGTKNIPIEQIENPGVRKHQYDPNALGDSNQGMPASFTDAIRRAVDGNKGMTGTGGTSIDMNSATTTPGKRD